MATLSKKSFLGTELAKIKPDTIRKGFKYSLLENLRSKYNLDRREVLSVTRISSATLDRNKKIGTLGVHESDKLYRLMTIIHGAENLFEGDKLKALEWCRKPARGLGEQTPFSFADTTAGQDLVLDYIGRIEHGVIS